MTVLYIPSKRATTLVIKIKSDWLASQFASQCTNSKISSAIYYTKSYVYPCQRPRIWTQLILSFNLKKKKSGTKVMTYQAQDMSPSTLHSTLVGKGLNGSISDMRDVFCYLPLINSSDMAFVGLRHATWKIHTPHDGEQSFFCVFDMNIPDIHFNLQNTTFYYLCLSWFLLKMRLLILYVGIHVLIHNHQ